MPGKVSPVSGLLTIDKPKGITSHDVVARVRKLAKQRKVGHAGTLDPMATGVLLVCLGQATRLIEYLMAGRKQYRATIRFGAATDTLDSEGKMVAQCDPSGLTETQLRAILPTFLGNIEQVPPIYSAIKKEGKPLYRRARAGEKIEVEPRRVQIFSLTWQSWQPPDLTIEVVCSPGTYIRALARDLGAAAGLCAHLSGLTRIASGNWFLSSAVPLHLLEKEAQGGSIAWQRHLHAIDQALTEFPRVTLDEETATQVKHGRQIELAGSSLTSIPPSKAEADLIRAYTPRGEFLAVLTRAEPDDKLWQPKKVFHSS